MKHEHVMKIDGKEVSLRANETISILEAAHSVGIEIPKLCSCKELGVKGNCRVCMVEVKGKGLSAACSTQAAENMIVETNSPLAIQHRKNIIELILANHNRNCQACEGNKFCQLQKIADDLNIVQEDFEEVFPEIEKKRFKSVLIINRNRCIKCGRCKAFCQQKNEAGAIGILGRGWKEMYDIDNMLPTSACTACGKCAEVCPVGCLNIDRHLERIWEYLDSEIAMKTVIFADTNIMKLQENICRVFECSMDRVQAFLHRVGFQKVLFEEIEEGEDISMALLPKSTSRFVLIGNDVRWKHLVEEEINLVGVLTLEDLHILLEQSMYEI